MDSPFVNVRVVRDGRQPVVYLRVSGFATVAEAKEGIVKSLDEDGIDGEGGDIKLVDIKEDGIDIETDVCGFGISDIDVKAAMKANGREVSC